MRQINTTWSRRGYARSRHEWRSGRRLAADGKAASRCSVGAVSRMLLSLLPLAFRGPNHCRGKSFGARGQNHASSATMRARFYAEKTLNQLFGESLNDLNAIASAGEAIRTYTAADSPAGPRHPSQRSIASNSPWRPGLVQKTVQIFLLPLDLCPTLRQGAGHLYPQRGCCLPSIASGHSQSPPSELVPQVHDLRARSPPQPDSNVHAGRVSLASTRSGTELSDFRASPDPGPQRKPNKALRSKPGTVGLQPAVSFPHITHHLARAR